LREAESSPVYPYERICNSHKNSTLGIDAIVRYILLILSGFEWTLNKSGMIRDLIGLKGGQISNLMIKAQENTVTYAF